jgi:aspartate racemase
MEKQASALWSIAGRNGPSVDRLTQNGDRPFLIESPKLPVIPQTQVPPLHELFQEAVSANPLAVALTFRGVDLSYDELNRRANRVAHRLRRMGVGPESLVGISIGRSVEFIISVLAIVKAGGAYVPLDLSYPRERLSFMLHDTHPSVLLVGEDGINLDAPSTTTLRVTADVAEFSIESDANLDVKVGPRNAAYVMYTSGSTGNPKGVVIEQRSIVRLVSDPNYMTISDRDTFLQLAPTSFDASTLEIWGALLNRARLVIMEPGTPSLKDIGRKIEQEQVTTLWLTAGLFHAMVDEQLPSLATVRNMLAGGDVLSPQHVERFLDAHRSSVVINGYGPTEGTTFTCCHVLHYGDTIGKTVPIGRPISKTRVLILDEALNQVSIGQPGELYIGGEGVARGYLNQPQLTAERFVRNPYSGDPSDVLYRSGDLVSVRADGAIEFLGRQDNQVKVRGFRIELGEIEVVLQQHPVVRHAVALVVETGAADKAIHAFWTEKAGAVGDGSDLVFFAGEHLPAYMVPSNFTRLESLPLTENGKVDRKQLLAIATKNVLRRKAYMPPSDMLEMQLIEIWEESLGVSCLGVQDDFFELGGHSLLAARMFAQIEQKLRKSLPLATMFHASTIQKLAEVIRAEGWTPYWSELVPIQPNGARPPLFLVHGLIGNVLNYYGLRHHVPHDQPVYGLQAEGLSSGRASHFSIPAMAAHYVELVRSMQPSGPYFLGGFSAGGLVAYEMAQQFAKAGEKVRFLALFDSSIDVVGGHWFKTFHSKRAKDRTIRALRANFHMMQNEGLGRFVRAKRKNLGINLRIMIWLLAGRLAKSGGTKPTAEPRFLTVREAFVRAIRAYTPSPYPGSAVLFRTHGSDLENPDPSNGWRNYIGGKLDIQEVEGDHNNIFFEPHIGRLADQLINALEGVNAEHEALQAK